MQSILPEVELPTTDTTKKGSKEKGFNYINVLYGLHLNYVFCDKICNG